MPEELSEKFAGLPIIDINCDLGEGMPCDAEIMAYISSCSIACGGHYGDEGTMRDTIALANKHQLKIGVHPSYPDKENFGRQAISMSAPELKASLIGQITTFKTILTETSSKLHHLKPHGALYNQAAHDNSLAELLIEVQLEVCPEARLYAPSGSQIALLAEKSGIKVVYEVFADRNYTDDLSLVSRSKNNALIHDTEQSYQHVKRMLLQQQVLSVNNNLKPIQADTICVHSDTQEAVAIVAKLHARLNADGFIIR